MANYLQIITDKDFGLEPKDFDNPAVRYGARGVILNHENKIAILHLAAKNAYKLIGGGIEGDETPEIAFKREALEEAGCKVEIERKLGVIREEKSQDNFIQDSHVFIAHVINDTGNFNLTQEETESGAELLWMNIDDAISAIKKCEDNIKDLINDHMYHVRFIFRRDAAILESYKNTKW